MVSQWGRVAAGKHTSQCRGSRMVRGQLTTVLTRSAVASLGKVGACAARGASVGRSGGRVGDPLAVLVEVGRHAVPAGKHVVRPRRRLRALEGLTKAAPIDRCFSPGTVMKARHLHLSLRKWTPMYSEVCFAGCRTKTGRPAASGLPPAVVELAGRLAGLQPPPAPSRRLSTGAGPAARSRDHPNRGRRVARASP